MATTTTMQTFATRLFSRRVHLGLTQHQLGIMADLSGQWICHFESGRRRPNIDNLVKLASALGVSTDWLLGR